MRFLSLAALAALLCLAALYPAPVAAEDWPTLRQNLQRTAYTPDCPQPPYAPQWVRADLYLENILCWCEPIIADGRVYIATAAGNVYALDRRDGKTLWKQPVGSAVMHSPAYYDGKLYLGLQGDWNGAAVLALDAATGEERWRCDTPRGGFWTSPAITEGLVLMGDRAGIFYGIDAEDGEIRWQRDLGAPILTTAAVKEGRVYVGAENMHGYCLNTADGELVWTSRQLDGQLMRGYCPVLWKDKVIFRSSSTLDYAAMEVEGAHLIQAMAGYPRNFQGLLVGTKAESWNPILEATYGEIAANGKWSYYNAGRVNSEQQGYRAKLQRRPALRSGFMLDQADGVDRTMFAVCYASGCGCPPVPPAVGPDESLYVLFKSFYSQWDVPIRAHDAVGRYTLEDELISLVRFTDPEDPKKNGLHTYFHITTDETNQLSVAGTILWNQHGTNGSRGWYVGAMDIETGKFVYGAGGEHGAYPTAFGLKRTNYALGSSGQVGATVVSDGQIFNLVNGVLTCIGPKADAPEAIANHGQTPPAMPAVEPADAGEITIAQLLDEVPAASDDDLDEDVRNVLAAAVRQLIEQGPWVPLRVNGRGVGSQGFWNGGRQFYFCLPSETLYALGRAYPYLDDDLKADVKAYLQMEWQRYKPWTNSIYDPGPGEGKLYDHIVTDLATRESCKLGYWLYGPYVRYNGVSGRMRSGSMNPAVGFYGIWLYGQSLGQWDAVKVAWPEMQASFATLKESAGKLSGPLLNWTISGVIGYGRIATHFDDAAARADAMALLKQLLDRRIELGNQRGLYRGAYDCTPPELWRYLAANAPQATAAGLQPDLFGTDDLPPGAQLPYAWGVGPHESRNGEGCFTAYSAVHAAFMARAYFYQQPADELRDEYLDLPWCPADLYYIDKLATVLERSAEKAWQRVATD